MPFSYCKLNLFCLCCGCFFITTGLKSKIFNILPFDKFQSSSAAVEGIQMAFMETLALLSHTSLCI